MRAALKALSDVRSMPQDESTLSTDDDFEPKSSDSSEDESEDETGSSLEPPRKRARTAVASTSFDEASSSKPTGGAPQPESSSATQASLNHRTSDNETSRSSIKDATSKPQNASRSRPHAGESHGCCEVNTSES